MLTVVRRAIRWGPVRSGSSYTPRTGSCWSSSRRANRLLFEGNDPFCGTPHEYTEAASRYIGYCGPFHVNPLNSSLVHEMQVSLFPNWLGQRQVRLAQIEGDLLRLATATPMNFGGGRKTATLVWRRAQPNS